MPPEVNSAEKCETPETARVNFWDHPGPRINWILGLGLHQTPMADVLTGSQVLRSRGRLPSMAVKLNLEYLEFNFLS